MRADTFIARLVGALARNTPAFHLQHPARGDRFRNLIAALARTPRVVRIPVTPHPEPSPRSGRHPGDHTENEVAMTEPQFQQPSPDPFDGAYPTSPVQPPLLPPDPENFGAQSQDFHHDPQYAPMPPTAPQMVATMPPPLPIRPNRTPLIVLAVLFMVTLAMASTMLVLYLDERGTNSSLGQQLEDRQRSLTDVNQKLAAANAHIDQLNTQINNLNNQVNTLTTSNSSLNTCLTALKSWITASNANAPNALQLAQNADSICGF
jgi:hypothetical protein